MLRVVRGDSNSHRREPEMWPEPSQDDRWSPEEEPREPRGPQPRRRRVSDHRDHRQGNLLFERIAFRVAIAFALICGAAALYFTAHNGGLDSLVARRSGEKAAKSTDALPAPAATAAAAPQQSAPPRPAGQAIPNADGLVILIRSSIIALQQANVSGDYAVLRDIGAPSFQQVNSPEKLSQAFADLRGRKMDLAEIAVVSPRLPAEPTIDAKGLLRLTGFFPAAAERVNFELAFQMVAGRWRLFGIGVHLAQKSAASQSKEDGKLAADVAGQVPDDARLVSLIRGSVISLNQANLTGDYSVLRGIAAPGFQNANTPDRLAANFAKLRARQLDLAPVTVIEPRLFRPAAVDAQGFLRVTGYFPSRPEQVNFDLAYQFAGGQWRLFGIGVNTSREIAGSPAGAPTAGANANKPTAGADANRPTTGADANRPTAGADANKPTAGADANKKKRDAGKVTPSGSGEPPVPRLRP